MHNNKSWIFEDFPWFPELSCDWRNIIIVGKSELINLKMWILGIYTVLKHV